LTIAMDYCILNYWNIIYQSITNFTKKLGRNVKLFLYLHIYHK
jgi:hypothetical protein